VHTYCIIGAVTVFLQLYYYITTSI